MLARDHRLGIAIIISIGSAVAVDVHFGIQSSFSYGGSPLFILSRWRFCVVGAGLHS